MNPATVGMYSYIQIFYSYIIDVLVFNSHLNALQYVGGATIFVFSVAAAFYKRFTQVTKEETKTSTV